MVERDLSDGHGCWRRVLWRAAVICLVGVGSGLVYNAFSDAGIPLEASALEGEPGSEISLEEARVAFDRKAAVFLDARSPVAYAAGHIPGALNLPVSDFERLGWDLLAGLPKDTPIVTYCSGSHCQSSAALAQLLIEQAGYTRVRVFFAGWPAWVEANYPTASGASQ